jgi:hypothetical protein
VLRALSPLALVALVLGVVLGVRFAVARHQGGPQQAATGAVSVPTNPAVEAGWGVRFSAVTVLADGGMVEVRYLVLDPAKAGRFHSSNLANLPVLVADDSGKWVHSYSQMLRVHTDHHGDDVEGRSYSLVYGNADAALHAGGLVSIVLADGLRLEHVPVS